MLTIRNSLRLAFMCLALYAMLPVGRAAGEADSGVTSIDTLARDVERAEAVRAVKNL